MFGKCKDATPFIIKAKPLHIDSIGELSKRLSTMDLSRTQRRLFLKKFKKI